jgi:Uma2 family endonuclease
LDSKLWDKQLDDSFFSTRLAWFHRVLSLDSILIGRMHINGDSLPKRIPNSLPTIAPIPNFPYFSTMSTVEKRFKASVPEYLAYEDSIEGKAEYCNGEIYVMSGASLNHNRLTSNLHYEMRKRLAGSGCEVFAGDFKIHMLTDECFYYPDISVFCGPIDLVNKRNDIANNPIVLVEILSDSTRHFNRGDKKHQYMTLRSLQEYVIVEQSRALVDVYWRNPLGKWEYETYLSMEDAVTFNALKISVPMQEIYAMVDFGK